MSSGIKIQMQLNTAAIEAKSAAKGINLRASDPVALVTQAATIVLSDEANEEMIKAINNGGHAFFAGKFDARKRPPSNAGHNAGGQTWQSNANGPAWNKDMRLCEMCPDGTPDNARGHMDKSCKYATPEKLAARGKMLEEKRATRKADWEKQNRPAEARATPVRPTWPLRSTAQTRRTRRPSSATATASRSSSSSTT